MRHHLGRSLLGALTVAALFGGARAQERPPGPSACALGLIGSAAAKTAIDGRTFGLADGREVRLAGIETPAEPLAVATATAALAALVSGRDLRLERLGAERDRHGRILAYAFATGDRQSVQQTLLAAGQARVAVWVGDAGCAADLLGAERAARGARLGVWADVHYAVHAADQPAAVLAERGRLTLVEGEVLSVRESGGTIYVNFGRRWSEDFTVTVPKRSERLFVAAGLELKKLSGRRVRVRGIIEERGGPWIEAVRPEQIELIERN